MGNSPLSLRKYLQQSWSASTPSSSSPTLDRGSAPAHRRSSDPRSTQHDEQPASDTKQVYTKQERKLIRKYLPDFIVERPSTREGMQIILNHWDDLNLYQEKPRGRSAFNANALPNAGAAVAAITNAGSDRSQSDASKTAAAPSSGVTRIVQLFDNFYEFLFEVAPELRPLFKTSIQFKGRALMNIVGGIKGLLQSEHIVDKAARIAFRHVEYGVNCKHFNPLGIALMRTLQSLAPALWTESTQHAWRVVFCHVSLLVVERLDKAIRKKAWNNRHPWLAIIIAKITKLVRNRTKGGLDAHHQEHGSYGQTSSGYSSANRVSSNTRHSAAESIGDADTNNNRSSSNSPKSPPRGINNQATTTTIIITGTCPVSGATQQTR